MISSTVTCDFIVSFHTYTLLVNNIYNFFLGKLYTSSLCATTLDPMEESPAMMARPIGSSPCNRNNVLVVSITSAKVKTIRDL